MLFPTDALIVSYETEPDCSEYETGIARWAHALLTNATMEKHITAVEAVEGRTLILLNVPVILWDLDKNRSVLLRAVVAVEENKQGRRDAWTSDEHSLMVRSFRANVD